MRKIIIFCSLILGFSLVNCHKFQDWEIIYPEVPVFSVSGYVVDEFTQMPLDSVSIKFFRNDTLVYSIYTGPDGFFNFDSLYSEKYINSNYIIKFKKYGFEDNNKDINLTYENLYFDKLCLYRTLLVTDEYDPPEEHPSGIAWDGANIWTCDEDNCNIYKHDKNMAVIETYSYLGLIPQGMTFSDTILWIGNKHNFTLYGFNKNFELVKKILLYYIKYANLDFPVFDFTFNEGFLYTCAPQDSHIGRFSLMSEPDSLILLDNRLMDCFTGLEWTGEYFLMKYARGFCVINNNYEILYYLKSPFPMMFQITYDGENFYCICRRDWAYYKIYKLKNIW